MDRQLYTLAYPRLAPSDRRWIDGFRNDYDLPHKDVVAPHFTMVFGCDNVDEETYRAHIDAVARETAPIEFRCRYAMLGADHESDTAYVFLVPDEGFGAISRLHDSLYRGLLATKLRLDLEFVPHMTIGTQADRTVAKSLCDDLNETGLSVAGTIDTLAISALQAGQVEDLSVFPLSG